MLLKIDFRCSEDPHKSDDKCQKKVLEMRINGRSGRSSLDFSTALGSSVSEERSEDCPKNTLECCVL